MESTKDMKYIDGIENQQPAGPAEAEPASNEPDKYELLIDYINMFKQSYNIDQLYKNKDSVLSDDEKKILFDNLICDYFQIIINAFKKLAKHDKKYMDELIEVYIEMWKTAPRLKGKNYFSASLYDLCEFLFENNEFAKLAFFYNLMIYSREIPFLTENANEETEGYLRDSHLQTGEEDPFDEFRKIKKKLIEESFDAALFSRAYERFFQILKFWKERAEGYYSKDEIFFMAGLFILDELIDLFYIKNEEKLINIDDFTGTDANKNIYNPVYHDKVNDKLTVYYEKALKYFKKALEYNPNNPRYFYEYARCLKNSGKSKEAELFFKKAFDLSTGHDEHYL